MPPAQAIWTVYCHLQLNMFKSGFIILAAPQAHSTPSLYLVSLAQNLSLILAPCQGLSVVSLFCSCSGCREGPPHIFRCLEAHVFMAWGCMVLTCAPSFRWLFCVSLFALSSLCLSLVQISYSGQDTGSIRWGAHPSPLWPHLDYFHLQWPYFQIKSHSERQRVKTSNTPFGRDIVQSVTLISEPRKHQKSI